MRTPQVTAEERAREHIDSVIAINRKYGMDGNISDEAYHEAASAATEEIRGSRGRTKAPA